MNSIIGPRGTEPLRLTQKNTDIVLDFGQIFGILKRGWWIIAGAGFVGTLIAVILVLQVPPSYTSSAKLLLGQKSRVDDAMGAMFPDLRLDDAAVSGEIAILTSARMLSRVTEALELENHPDFNPALGPADEGPGLVEQATDVAVGFIKGLLGQSGEAAAPEAAGGDAAEDMTIETAALTGKTILGDQSDYVDQLSANLRVSQEGRSNLLNIRFISNDRMLAAAVPNKLVDIYLEDQIDRRFGILSRVTSGLEGRLESMRNRLEETERAVIEFRNQNLAEGFGDRSQLDQQLGDLSTRLSGVTAEYAEQASDLRGVDAMIEEQGALSTVGLFSSPVIDGLESTLAELRERSTRLRSQFGEDIPQLASVQSEIERLETALTDEIMRLRDDQAREVELTAARRSALRDELRTLEQRAISQAEREVRLAQLEREQNAARLVYETFLDRFTETREIVDLQEGDAEIIDYADPPAAPFAPNKKLSAGLGGFAGVFIGVALVFMLHLSKKRLTSTTQLQSLLPSYNVVPMPVVRSLARRKDPLRVALRPVPSPLGEAIRSLRTTVLLSSPARAPNVVSVVSPLAGAGKTTTAINLARSISRMGRSCVLIDADLRRGDIARLLNLHTSLALNDLLEGACDLSAVVQKDRESDLNVITSRRGSTDPTGSLLGPELPELVEKLKAHFGTVVIDTAPLLKVSDAQPILRLSDSVVMVVPHGSQVDELRAAIGRLVDVDAYSRTAVYSMVPDRDLSPYY